MLHTDTCCIDFLHVFFLVRQVKLLPNDLFSNFPTVALQMQQTCFQLEDNLTGTIMAFFLLLVHHPQQDLKVVFHVSFHRGIRYPSP